MANSKDCPTLPVQALETDEIYPGVRVTRRIALQNSAAAVLLLALSLQGCAEAEEGSGDETDSEDEESQGKSKDKKSKGKSDAKNKKKKSGKKEDSQGDSGKEEPEGDQDEEPDSEEEEEPESKESEGDDKPEEEPEGDENPEEEKNPEDEDDSPLTLDEILELVIADAKKLTKDKSLSEAQYQKRVNKLLARLDKNEKVPKLNPGAVHNMRVIASKNPIHIFVMEMAPNARIPLHDHSNRIGNILGWRGKITTTNYTRIKDREDRKDGSFLLQESDRREITKGQTGYLARVEHNFHIVKAGPQGATLLDMFTYYDDSQAGVPGKGSRFVRLGQVVDKQKKIYRASYSRALAHLSPHDFS